MQEIRGDEELQAFAAMTRELLPDDASPDDRIASGVIWHIVRLARHAEQRLEFEVHRPLGWSWAGFRIMINTYVLEPVEPSYLAAILGVARPTVTSTLDKLERDGLLVRKADPANKRQIQVSLTKRGREAVKKAIPRQLDVERELLAGLTEAERLALHALLNGMLRSMKPRGAD